jgi:hypothetical protein
MGRRRGPQLNMPNVLRARAVNAEPWEPPPGMVKLQCPECQYFFAAYPPDPGVVTVCFDCIWDGLIKATESGNG